MCDVIIIGYHDYCCVCDTEHRLVLSYKHGYSVARIVILTSVAVGSFLRQQYVT